MNNSNPIIIYKSENYAGNEKNESLYSVSNGRTGIEDLSFESLKELSNLLTEYIGREEKMYNLSDTV